VRASNLRYYEHLFKKIVWFLAQASKVGVRAVRHRLYGAILDESSGVNSKKRRFG
jgi:hypothetical protein